VAAAINNLRIELYTNNNVEVAKAILKEVKKQKDLIEPMELADAKQMLATYVDPKTGMMPNMRESNETTADAGLQNGLMSNYPNPFNPSTKISYTLSTSGQVTLKIFDVLGREVATLVNEVRSEGKHEAVFNASALASGVYFCRIEISPIEGGRANRVVKTMKMLVTK
jgi:hypothetical protein